MFFELVKLVWLYKVTKVIIYDLGLLKHYLANKGSQKSIQLSVINLVNALSVFCLPLY